MKFTPIADPLPGERTAAVIPTPAPLVQTTWSRPRYVTGRAVADTALAAEQNLRMGQATLLGQSLQPGVVTGLEVANAAGRIEVAPGLGLCGTGEDVVVAAPASLDPVALLVRGAEVLIGGDPGDAALVDVLAAVTGRLPALPPPPGSPAPVLTERVAARLVEVDSDHTRAAKVVPEGLVKARASLMLDRTAATEHEALVDALDRAVRQVRAAERLGTARLDELAEQFAEVAGEAAVKRAIEDAAKVYKEAGATLPNEKQVGLRELAVDGLASPVGDLHDPGAMKERAAIVESETDKDTLEALVKAAMEDAAAAGMPLAEADARLQVLLELAHDALDRDPGDALAATIEDVRDQASAALLERWGAAVAEAAELLGVSLDADEVLARTLDELSRSVFDGELTLEELAEDPGDPGVGGPDLLPPVALVLVAEPAYVDDLGAAGDPTDPCERDPDAEPFQDWRYVDAAAFAWVPVEAWLAEALPATDPAVWWAGVTAGADSVDALRNRLVWALFALERTAPPPPWARGAVPVALGAFATDGALVFLDRPAVVRVGGRRAEDAGAGLLASGAHEGGARGRSAQWQAQLEQLQEQLADLVLTPETRLADTFRWLPPCGVLPLGLFDLAGRTTRALPAGWGLNAAPVPLEQLESAMRSAASLAPFDLHVEPGDELKLLLPVGQDQWDPGLLRVHTVAEDFWAALREARGRFDERLAATAELQAKIDALYRAVGGIDALPVRPADDGTDGDAGLVISAAFWRNDAALAEVAAAAADPAGPWSDAESVEAFVAGALGPGPLADAVAAAFEAVRQPRTGTDVAAEQSRNGPVVAVTGALGTAPSTVLGPGFALDGGWSHARAVPDDPFPAWAVRPWVYLVRGEADTEAIDRAVALAGSTPLVVVCTALSAAAREEMDWRYVREAETPPPLVVILPLDPVTDVDRLDDVAVRMGLKDALDSPVPGREQFAEPGAVGGVAVTSTRAVFAGVVEPRGDVDARVATIVASLPTLGGEASPAYQRALARIRTLVTHAGVVVVPDAERADGTRDAEHTRAVVGLVDAMRATVQAAEDPLVLTANELIAGIAAEATWGTIPSPTGLGVELVDELLLRLSAMKAPRSEAPVLTAEELALVLGDANGTVGVGLGGFAAVMEEKANRADDAVDFAFMRVQAAIFRLRQHMTGRDKATRMASSPILAEVADLIVPDATPSQLGLFFDAMKTGRGDKAPSPTGGGGGTGGGGTITPSGIAPEITDARLFEILGGIDPIDPVVGWTTPGKLELADIVGQPILPEPDEPVFEAPDRVIVTESETRVPGTLGDKGTKGQGTRPDLLGGTGTKGDRFTVGERAELGVQPVELAVDPKLGLGGTVLSGTVLGGAVLGGGALGGVSGGVRGLPKGRGTGPGGLGRMQAGPVGEAQALTGATTTYDALSLPMLTYTAPTVTTSTTFSIARVVDSISYVQALRPVDFVVRSTGIATRLEEPAAAEITRESYALRASVTQTLSTLELNLAKVPMPLLIVRLDPVTKLPKASIEWVALDDKDTTADPGEPERTYAEAILAGEHDPKTTDGDEAALFSDATRNLEAVAGMLRVVEAQVRLVRDAVETARRARTVLLSLIAQAEAREQALAESLAESRQDLFATSALLAEEQERADEINARRARVLAEAVPFLAFHRVREVTLDDAPPVHDLAPTLTSNPAVEALNHPAAPAPRELHLATELLKEAPARWLVAVARALPKIDRAEAMRRTLDASRLRAVATLQIPIVAVPTLVGLRGLDLVAGLTANRAAVLSTTRHASAALRTEAVSRLTWQQAQSVARTVLSVGDLTDGGSVPPIVARAASEELDRIHTVAAALYQELSLVEPRIRARWVLRLGQYDQPLALRDLSVLPDWASVGADPTRPDPLRKQELQALVDWLFARVVADEPEAVALVDDLVRVAILLASHAPVGRILAGQVDAPVPVAPGARVSVTVDAEKLRIGMTALVLAGSTVRARAVVEDLGSGRVTARIVSASTAGVVLQPGDAVRFVESDGVVLPEGDAAQPAADLPLVQLVDPPVLRAWLARAPG